MSESPATTSRGAALSDAANSIAPVITSVASAPESGTIAFIKPSRVKGSESAISSNRILPLGGLIGLPSIIAIRFPIPPTIGVRKPGTSGAYATDAFTRGCALSLSAINPPTP